MFVIHHTVAGLYNFTRAEDSLVQKIFCMVPAWVGIWHKINAPICNKVRLPRELQGSSTQRGARSIRQSAICNTWRPQHGNVCAKQRNCALPSLHAPHEFHLLSDLVHRSHGTHQLSYTLAYIHTSSSTPPPRVDMWSLVADGADPDSLLQEDATVWVHRWAGSPG